MIPIDYSRLLNAADRLVSNEDQMAKCPNCEAVVVCSVHAEEWAAAMSEVRAAIGRPAQEGAG